MWGVEKGSFLDSQNVICFSINKLLLRAECIVLFFKCKYAPFKIEIDKLLLSVFAITVVGYWRKS